MRPRVRNGMFLSMDSSESIESSPEVGSSRSASSSRSVGSSRSASWPRSIGSVRAVGLIALIGVCAAIGGMVTFASTASAQRIEVHGQDEPASPADEDRGESGSITVGIDADGRGARIIVHGEQGDSAGFRFDARFDSDSLARDGDDRYVERGASDREQRDPFRGGRSRADERVAFGSDIVIPRDMVVDGDVVAILGSVVVEGGVRGQVVSIGGKLDIGPEARIGGEAVCIGGGHIHLESGAVVRGEVVAVGGAIHKEEGALIGERIEVNIIPTLGMGTGFAGLSLLLQLGQLILVAAVGLILLQVSLRRWQLSALTLKNRGWESLLAGVGGGIVYLILILPLLVVTIIALAAVVIGIPLIPVVALLMLMFPLPGYVIAGLLLGLTVMGRHHELEGAAEGLTQVPPAPPLQGLGRSFILGHLLLSLPGIVGVILGILGASSLVTGLFLLIHSAVIFLAIGLGWGAFLLSRFGRRPPAGLMASTPGTATRVANV